MGMSGTTADPPSVGAAVASDLAACPRCGLVMRVTGVGPGGATIDQASRARRYCPRCLQRLPARDGSARSLAWPASLALAALILYPAAMSLPILELRKLGHARETTIWTGTVQLFTSGHAVIGSIVFACSIVIPLAKIGGIFTLCLAAGRDDLLHRRHQARTYGAIDWLGRWGMIDVLLVAILVAAVKLGDWVDVHPGPGVVAFAAVVLLSMLASLTFDPRAIWTPPPTPTPSAPSPTSTPGSFGTRSESAG
ncbi:MAG: paraquat-inducible protein A [Phycisphaerales bacterium]